MVPHAGRRFALSEVLLLAFNIADSALTHRALSLGVAVESNPVLAAAWQVHPLTFHGAKAALVLGGAAILHHLRGVAAARAAMDGAAAAYGAVVAWHLAHVCQ